MGLVRTVWTLARIAGHILWCLIWMLDLRIRKGRHWAVSQAGKDATQKWMRILCNILGLEIEVEGEASPDTVLMVSNHSSWLDIVALSSQYPYSFLAKSEIRNWPIVGFLARSSGNLFIKRHSVSGLKHAVRDVTEMLQEGRSVCLFPEGTTIANGMNPFKSGLFTTANNAGVPIQPVAIKFQQEDTAYVNDDHFVSHMLKQLGKHKIHVKIKFLPLLQPHEDRRELAKQAQTGIAASLEAA